MSKILRKIDHSKEFAVDADSVHMISITTKILILTVAFFTSTILPSCSSGSSSFNGDREESNGGGDRPTEGGEGVAGYLTFFIDSDNSAKVKLSGSGTTDSPATIVLASGSLAAITLIGDPAFQNLQCALAPTWVAFDATKGVMTFNPPSEQITAMFDFSCRDDLNREFFISADIRGGADATEFISNTALTLNSSNIERSNAGIVTLEGSLTGEIADYELKVSLKDTVTNKCIDNTLTSFNKSCPNQIKITPSASWNWTLQDSSLIHKRAYELSAVAITQIESTGKVSQSFTFKKEVGALLQEIMFDTGDSKDEVFRDALVLNDGIYTVGYGYDLVNGTSARDLIMQKFQFDGTAVTSGFWGSAVNYAFNFGTDGEYPNCMSTDGNGNLFVSGHGAISQFMVKFGTDGQQLNSFRYASGKEGHCHDMYGSKLYLAGGDNDQAGDGPGGTDTLRDWTIKEFDFDFSETIVPSTWPVAVDSGTQTQDFGFDVKVDSSGIYSVGVYDNPGARDYFVRRFGLDGSLSWSTYVGSGENGATMARVLIVDDEIWVSAPVANELDLTSGDDWVVAVFDKALGTEKVGKRNSFGSLTGPDEPRALVYHALSDTILVGGYLDEVGEAENWMIKSINRDGSINSSFTIQQDFNGMNDKINSLRIDSGGDVYAIGYATDYANVASGRDSVLRVYSGP